MAKTLQEQAAEMLSWMTNTKNRMSITEAPQQPTVDAIQSRLAGEYHDKLGAVEDRLRDEYLAKFKSEVVGKTVSYAKDASNARRMGVIERVNIRDAYGEVEWSILVKDSETGKSNWITVWGSEDSNPSTETRIVK